MQVPGVNLLDFSKEKDVVKKLKEMTVHGPDVGIESVGCHYNKSLVHTIETAIGMETDTGDVMNEIIQAVRKVKAPSEAVFWHGRRFILVNPLADQPWSLLLIFDL